MGGETLEKRPKLLVTTPSTPTQNTAGKEVLVQFAKLATYTVDVRSFHPNTNFEPLGFRFHGDNRGFSVGKSFFDKRLGATDVTSRVWQRYSIDASNSTLGDLSKSEITALDTESNPSKPGPFPWSAMGHEEPYRDINLKPRGKLELTRAASPHGGQKELSFKSWYGGENHAFMGSVSMQRGAGVTHVPTLDVFSELFVRIERIQLYMDIVSLVYGDGFPNTESFITDSNGTPVFLGSHVRIGAPATHLWGKEQRLMWATAIRVEIDSEGNFGERLWTFAHALGGPPDLRDEYSTSKYPERCRPGAKPELFSNPFDDSPATFTWDCGRPEYISRRKTDSSPPLHLSAFVALSKVREQLDRVWLAGPLRKTSRREWNDWHLHRDPNGGRTADSYDLASEKWKRD